MKYVTYSSDGELTGSFWQDLQPEHAGNYVEVEEDVRTNWTHYKLDIISKQLQFVDISPTSKIEVPASVPMRSARLMLLKSGLLSTVQNYFDSLSGIDAEEARINWEFALTVQRNDPLVKQLIPNLGKSEAEIDQMFIEAAKL